MEFKFEDNSVVVQRNDKKYEAPLDFSLFQCKEHLDFLKNPKSLPLIVSMVFKNSERFETNIEERNDLACDISGASSSTPREHLKVNFVVTRNDEKIPVYFNLIHYSNE